LPRTTIDRRKHGFALPVSSLIRDDLRGLVETVLLDHSNPIYAYLHRSKVLEYWDQHISEKRDHGKKLWALFMLASFFNCQFHSP
jgi:asparagine synthase (glutamine-hydrolysing)